MKTSSGKQVGDLSYPQTQVLYLLNFSPQILEVVKERFFGLSGLELRNTIGAFFDSATMRLVVIR